MFKKLRLISLVVLGIIIILYGYFTVKNLSPPNIDSESEYAAEIIPEITEYTALVGERVEMDFELKNTGEKAWLHKGDEACFFSYHLLGENGEMVQFDNRRILLPETVRPGESIQFSAVVPSPMSEGTYILEFDLLREGIAWFEDYGSPTAEVILRVQKRQWDEKGTFFRSSLKPINELYELIRVTLEQNEVTFKGKSGTVYGFSPGKDYPQIWLRDSNTILPAARYFYEESYLLSWLKEHLYHQKENGALYDWIDSRGETDKNTTETDQEASAVQAAYQAYGIMGTKWLEKKVKGERIIDRLGMALEYVLLNRFEERMGLLTGAHTADWGDVDMVDKGQEAVYVDERTKWTADIYDQAMFYKACMELAEMREALGEKKKARDWRGIALSLGKSTNQRLWQEEKGFYRIHLHLSPWEHEFDEGDMFAMGGNAAAVISGMADSGQAQQIIETALKRQKQYEVSTISGTLLPPYPENTFEHALMDQPYEYQNGGQWDWFGGRLIYSMFENGYSAQARDKLIEVIEKNINNRGFFEWDTREGTGRGSDLFCGSAGVMTQAVVEGYFGIKIRYQSLSIEPKLGKESGHIRVVQPANKLSAEYDYQYDEKNFTITLRYKSSFQETGIMSILIPQSGGDKTRGPTKQDFQVSLDGENIDFDLKRVNSDVFVEFQTDFNDHEVVVTILKAVKLGD
ncbi:MAG: hypothetical protein R6V00_01080 [Candidatus Aminicenantes bacterium]